MIEGDAFHYPLTNADMQTGELAAANLVEQQPIDPTIWVDLHGDYLFRYAMMRLRDGSLAEDAVQETLLAAIQAMASYTGKASERTWLTSILRHKIELGCQKKFVRISRSARQTVVGSYCKTNF